MGREAATNGFYFRQLWHRRIIYKWRGSVTGENVRALDEKNRLYVAGGWRRANATYIICEAGISAGFRLSSRR
jgi:hypothetical protein